MNTRLARIALLVLVTAVLAITPFASAQEGPAQVGMRPDAPPYALHGPYWVGTRELVIEPESDRPLPVTIWYPALNPEGTAEQTEYYVLPENQLPVAGHALLDAPADPAGGAYPLVIFSHGAWGTRLEAPYFTEHLASYGFVVMAPDHTGNTTVNAGESQHRHNILRPLDVIRAIDFATTLTGAGGILEGRIHTDHVAVSGHSFGAWTSLAAAGAQMNLKAYETWCAENPQSDPLGLGLCTSFTDHQAELAELAGLDAVPEGLWPSMYDARVKAAIALAPGTAAAFGSDGLAAVSIPVMIVTGSADSIAPPEYHAYLGYEWLQNETKALVVLDGADHMVFATPCYTVPWSLPAGFWNCSDAVWDMDRAHDLIDHVATAFLLATLKGDADAAAALAPDAVSFPGITYEATGF